MRAKTMGQLWESTAPSTFLAWAERMQFAMPEELVEAVRNLGIQVADWKTLFEQQRQIADQASETVRKGREEHLQAVKNHAAYISGLHDKQKELSETVDKIAAAKDERIAWLQSRIAELETTQPSTEKREIGARERESLIKLVIGMAVGGYGLNPKDARNRATKEIADNLQCAGVPLDVDTVRKYLAEGREMLPGDETEQKA